MRAERVALMLRLPLGLHRQIVRGARQNERSLNAEIIARLLEPHDRRAVVEETIKTVLENGWLVRP